LEIESKVKKENEMRKKEKEEEKKRKEERRKIGRHSLLLSLY